MQDVTFTIKTAPRTKKNHQRIIRTKNGKRAVIPSTAYEQYERDAFWFIPHNTKIDHPVNVKAVFYMDTKRRVDLVNLQEALLDVLVRVGCLADDNSSIVASMDGSRVEYDKNNPRTEVTISDRTGA